MIFQIHHNRNGLPALHIETPEFLAEILLQGAHVTRFFSKALQRELLWVAPNETWISGHAIRGGVPLAFPWFGVHSQYQSYPRHGFVRNLAWQLSGAPTQSPSGNVSLTLALTDSPVTQVMFPHAFKLELHLVLDASGMHQELVIHNTGTTPFTCEALLHPYFAVQDITSVTVKGLEGATYLDKVKNLTDIPQTGPLSIPGNVDYVYTPSSGKTVILESGVPRIEVTQNSGEQTVVWNPGPGKVNPAPNFLCVEPGRVLHGAFEVAPNSTESLKGGYRLLG